MPVILSERAARESKDTCPAGARFPGGYPSARPAGLGDDVGLALVLLGIENVVRNVPTVEEVGDGVGFLDTGRAHEDRLATFHAVADIIDDGVVFLLLRQIDEIGAIVPDHGLVGGNDQHFQAVDLAELEGLGVGVIRPDLGSE